MGTRGGRDQAVRIIVVTRDDAATVRDCLDGIAEQRCRRVEVVVVDLESTDGSADVAIRHPLPSRVTVARAGSVDRILDAGTDQAEGAPVLVLAGDLRPGPGWLETALTALEGHDLVVGPAGPTSGPWSRNAALHRDRLRHLALDVDDVEDLRHRVRTAGASLTVVRTMQVDDARPSTWRAARRPVVRPCGPLTAPTELVSVVLCTRDRPDELARCLRSLAQLEDPHHEVLVVDNHDVPTVDPALLPPRARLVHEPRRGLDVARNRGLREATGDVVAYVDDDCEVDPHWLAGIRAGFVDPAVRAVTGRVRPASLEMPSQRWFEAHFSFDRGVRPEWFTPWDRRPWYPMWSGGVGAGCNMAFRRDELEALSGFDEDLDMGTRIGGGGDLDVFSRVLDRGSLVAYRPDALVWHHHRASERRVICQFFGYGVAVGALVTKTVLDRPGHRVLAVRFYLDRLRVGLRLGRAARAGTHVLPLRLVVIDVAGQLAGPAVYLATRGRAGRRQRPRC